MKLHWVELENWRQHTKTRIDFDEGTTVIHGSNETGKSTVLEALSRGLFDKSSSSAEAIKRIKPLTASGNVTSTVRIEFTLNKTRYHVEKNFNLRKGASLSKVVGKKTILLSQDNSADEELIQLLEADLPSTRGSKPSQWGAFHWLWAPQDNRELPTDKEGDPTATLHLEAKDGKAVLVTPKFQTVRNLAQASYEQYFTTTGKTSKDSRISNIEKEIQALQLRSIELGDKIAKVDGEKQQLEELQRQFPILEKKFIQTKEEIEKARDESIDFSSIESKLNASEASGNEAERNVQDAKRGLKELRASAEKIEEFQKEEEKARVKFSRYEALCEQLEKLQQQAKEKVDEKAMKIRQCEELTRDARILWTKSDAIKKIDLLEKKTKRIKKINENIKQLRKKEVPIMPADKEMDKLIQSHMQIEALKESLTARGLAVNVTLGEKGSLEVEVDGERIKEKLTATGTENVSVKAPGLGKVTVKAKLEKARDAKADILRLEENIHGALSKYAVSSIEALRKLSRTQKEISSSIKELIAEKRGVDKRSIKEIVVELEKIKEGYGKLEKAKRALTAVKLNPIDGDFGRLVNKREREQEEAKDILDEARIERDKIDKELVKKREKLTEIRVEQEHLSKDLDDSKKQEREIVREYGSTENQEKILKNKKADLKARKEEYKKIKQQYEELEKGPRNRMKRLEQQIEKQEQLIREQRTSVDQLKGGIRMASLGGEYSELAEVESSMEIFSERLEKEQIRAESYKFLKEALEQQYRSALSAVVGPIQEEVKRSLSYVTGFLHEDVELNEYLFPTRLGERGFEDISLEFNDGSSGLKEVLALCVRLAVAKHLSERDSQCLVLDDPFVHVSSDRSNKMIELINEAIKEYGLQMIVFTHRQMEFAGFTGKMIDIQSVK